MTQRLSAIHNLIIDMDGVLYIGENPLRGMRGLFQFLAANDVRFVLATNNSTQSPSSYSEKLLRMGVEVPAQAIMTSATAAADYLANEYAPGTRIFPIGESGLHVALEEHGFVMAERDVSLVVVGLDRFVTYDKLAKATLLIRGGARFVATNPDKTLPIPEGEVPGAGAILSALETSTGVSPLIIGKPEPHFYTVATRQLGSDNHSTAALGDRLDTDIAGARRAGLFSILVLSGISALDEASASLEPPDLIVRDLDELVQNWMQAIRCRV
jgi:4-nitrophenyl phosphatase